MTKLEKWLPFHKKEESRVPVTREGQHPLLEMRREMDELFDRFLSEPFGLVPRIGEMGRWFGDYTPGRFMPTLDVEDAEDAIVISAELPGLGKDDVKLTVDHDVLVIRGEKREEKTEEEKGYYRTERSYGHFERRVPLPVEVKVDAVDARFEKGVLKVTLPKVNEEAAKPHDIPISGAA